MSTKLKSNKYRAQFRPNLFIQNIHELESYDPNYEYKNVINTYKHDPGRIIRYLDKGWELVESTEKLVDDRAFTPNSKEDSLRSQLVKSKTKCGHEQFLLRCHKDRRAQNEKAKKEQRDELFEQATRKRGGKIERRGNEVRISEMEINENNAR